jgi:hypothetical protein
VLVIRLPMSSCWASFSVMSPNLFDSTTIFIGNIPYTMTESEFDILSLWIFNTKAFV